MRAKEIACGDSVFFSNDVIKRLGYEKTVSDAVGLVLEITGRVAKVDFQGTWIGNDTGSTIRYVPVANLTLKK